MPEVVEARGRNGWGWWFGLTIKLGTLILIALIGFYAIYDRVPAWVYWQAGLGFLIALEVAYVVGLGTAILALPVLVVTLVKARRRGIRRPLAARGVLLGVTILFGAAMMETAAAVWQARVRRDSAVPAGERVGRDGAEDPATLPLPRAVALPDTFPEPTPEGQVNLVVIGESSAEGVPYNFWTSVGRMIAWKLQETIPARRFRLDVLAFSGETLERQHRKLADLKRRPDVLIVYCGHNEFSARFPPQRSVPHYLDARPPGLGERTLERMERTSPLCGMIRQLADKCRIAIPPRPGADRALVDVPIYTTQEYQILLADFRRRLEQIVVFAKGIGALPILVIPPGSDSGFEPNRSVLPTNTPYAEREAFAREFQAARRLEASDPQQSLERYRVLVARQPGFGETHYRLARLLEHAGAWDEAYRHDIQARDLDGNPVRCPSAFQDAYREVAARHAAILIDSQRYFHTIAPHGLLDDHLFHDGMHPSLRGQIALAQAILQGLSARGVFGWPKSVPAPTIDPAECTQHFGLGREEWKRLCLWGIMFYDKMSPLRYDPSWRRAKQDRFGKAFEKIEAGQAPEAVGLPNIGLPPAVPPVADAAVWTKPDAERAVRDGAMVR